MQRKAEINIGVTMGDPNGIGPEILLRALEYIHPFQAWQPLIFGDTEILSEMNKIMGFNFSFEAINILANIPKQALEHKSLQICLSSFCLRCSISFNSSIKSIGSL